ncbi:hypothetical protein [Anatilimnocola floriformis]|uniref:hypothetical protein n=1 Tax=Anatilimnocola floriformis TaxID=2948575 RepID=UPI0020C37F13|nr:hypothetical protein [Anatilimnocola floriformis]
MAVAHNIDVLIQANTEKFDKNLDKSEKKTKEFANNMKPWLEALFGKTGGGLAQDFMKGGAIAAGATVAIAAIGALTGAIKSAFQSLQQLVSDGFGSLDQLGDVAKKIGISAASLVVLQLAADQSGSNVEDLNASLTKMVRNISEAARQGGPAAAALAQIGLDAQQLARLKPEDQVKAIADGLSKLGNAGDRLSIINDIFGKTGSSLNELLQGGGKGIDEFREKASRLGLLFSDGEIAQVQNAQDAYSLFGKSLQGLGQHFAVALAPLTQGLFEMFANEIGGMTEALHPVFEQIRNWTPAILQMTNITIQGFKMMGQIIWEFRTLFAFVFGGPITALIVYFGENILNLSQSIGEALAFTESVLTRWEQVWEVALLGVALDFVKFGNDCLNMFGTLIPNLLMNFASACVETFMALSHNVGEIFAAMWLEITTFGEADTDMMFKPMFDGFKRAAAQASKDMKRPLGEMEKELKKSFLAKDNKLAIDIAGDMTKRMAELRNLMKTPDVDFGNADLGGEMNVTTKLAPGALEKGSSAAFEAIVNAQEKQGDPLLTEAIKGNRLQQDNNRILGEINQKGNQLAAANLR